MAGGEGRYLKEELRRFSLGKENAVPFSALPLPIYDKFKSGRGRGVKVVPAYRATGDLLVRR